MTTDPITAYLDTLTPTAQPFVLRRHEDVTGISGTGVVADGVLFPTAGGSKAVVRWRGERGSTVIWDHLRHVHEIHGHDGRTTVELVPIDELIAALKAVATIRPALGLVSASQFVRGQDSGWDQALAEVRRTITVAITALHSHVEG
ncbi:hypothetical protein [Kitasatospora viridis]|uniref:Uncharacterized protein n=1 Tax=Kitasatospora viridis TaxID=281105 RepID=A0A561UKS7_9ACTN|nr:hypothetical protein [Kitasatospora viridis]TWF99946.1 hypothetical protein FHX73_113806 [Kitasatospora viridis]